MTDKKQMITAEECAFEVGLMARRTTLLHHYFSETIIEELGEKKGKELIKKAIWAYGQHCGNAVREGVEAMGLPPTDENYGKVRDLPAYGWETGKVEMPDGEPRTVCTFCPQADTIFKELGPRGIKLGRLYCYVDRAHYKAYNPKGEFFNTKNVLDGDDCCEFLIEPEEKKG